MKVFLLKNGVDSWPEKNSMLSVILCIVYQAKITFTLDFLLVWGDIIEGIVVTTQKKKISDQKINYTCYGVGLDV